MYFFEANEWANFIFFGLIFVGFFVVQRGVLTFVIFLHIKAVDLQADCWSILKTFWAGFENDVGAIFGGQFWRTSF